MTCLRHWLKRCLLRIAPGVCIRRFAPSYPFEPEFSLVPLLSDRKRISVDVGASTGIYTIQMLAHASGCLSIEPRPQVAQRLREKFVFAGSRVQIEEVALSDRPGEATLRVPKGEGGRATIDPANALADAQETDAVAVTVRRLDDLIREPVGFIKMDVEGHELSALRGAENCLRTGRPALLVEIDDAMHVGTRRDTTGYLAGLGYRTFFLWQGSLVEADQLVPEVHLNAQNSSAPSGEGLYVRNYVFVHRDDDRRLAGLLSKRMK